MKEPTGLDANLLSTETETVFAHASSRHGAETLHPQYDPIAAP